MYAIRAIKRTPSIMKNHTYKNISSDGQLYMLMDQSCSVIKLKRSLQLLR
jgi:hypothetical protein